MCFWGAQNKLIFRGDKTVAANLFYFGFESLEKSIGPWFDTDEKL